MKATHAAVRDVLATAGPLTGTEIASYFPASERRNVSAIISTMRHDMAVRQIHITRWVREVEGEMLYLRAVYKLGSGRDIGKPPALTNAERGRRYRARLAMPKVAARTVPNSVWALAT